MSVNRRGNTYQLRIRPFGKLINIRTSAQTKTEARQIERSVLAACRSGDYRALNPVEREVCVGMFRNQAWEIPDDLNRQDAKPKGELCLWEACELFLNYPEIRDSSAKERHIYSLNNLVGRFGKQQPIKSLSIRDLREYREARTREGATPSTINKEMSTLSRLFAVMIELEVVDNNPVRLIKRLSEKSGERDVYLSLADIEKIASKCPAWFQAFIWVAFYTGMRRGEIFGLTWKQVDLRKRMIVFGPEDTKESHWKRVPIHRELVPIFEEAIKLRSLTTDRIFLLQDEKGLRPPTIEAVKNPWGRACEALKKAKLLKEPFPRFHDLRHTWKTNARRSGMDSAIAESILGHCLKRKSVSDRYDRISDQDLLQAIDQMTFNHGETEILLAKLSARDQNVTKTPISRKKATSNVT